MRISAIRISRPMRSPSIAGSIPDRAFSRRKTIFDMIEEHIEQGRELGSAFPGRYAMARTSLTGQAKAALHGFGPRQSCPVFNDPMPGNFLISAEPSSPKPMRLIDYEFASNNERSYELGVLFAEMFLRRAADRAAGRAISRHAPPFDGGARRRQSRAARRSQMGVMGSGQP